VDLPRGFRRSPPPGLRRDGDSVDDEIRFHIESRIAELVSQGLDEDEARRRAQAEFGDADRAARAARRESRRRGTKTMGRWIADGARDAALAVRQLGRNPGFAAAALLTLALGIGGTTAVFSVVDAVLVRPLPFPDEERVARIWPVVTAAADGGRRDWSVPDLEDWRERSRSLSALGAYADMLGGLVVRGGGTPEEVPTAYITSGFFEALGTPAALGRTLPPDAEEADPRVVVLSDGFWHRRFGADPGVVGASLDTEDGAYRIAGVMPRDFAFPEPEIELWTFLANVSQQSVPWLLRQVRVFQAVARVAPGTDPGAAATELAGVARAVAADFPDTNAGLTGVELVPIREALVGDVRLPLLLVAGAVGLTLLIACVNVANLLLARGTARAREFALRAALGAARGRLARQLLAESLLLGLVGGAVGVGVAAAMLRTLVTAAGDLLPLASTVTMDARVLTFAAAASVLTGFLFGLFPAARVTRGGAPGLQSGDRSAAESREAGKLRDGLVFAEVALAVVLLVGGGLLMRSFAELRAVDPGFDPDGLLVADMVVSDARHSSPADYLAFRDQLLERLKAIPGVTGASTAKQFPTRGMGETWSWSRFGDPPALPGEERRAQAMHIHRDFFDVMGIPILRGMPPGEAPELSLVINERLAREAYGSAEAAAGAAFYVGGLEEPVPIRAVVGDVLHDDPASPPPPMIYLDDRLNTRRVFAFVIRTDGDPLGAVEPFRRALAEQDPLQAVQSIHTARSALADAVAQPRFFALLMALFASVAMALAAVGIYGVIAYSVRRRTREIGVRIALGADRRRVRAMVVTEALRAVIPAVIVGLAAAAALSSLLATLLFEVRRLDPVTYAGVAAGVLAVALFASWTPAREATRVDPQVALRAE